ncbi:superfamily II DNA/RNA helicase [Micrococcus endophyticus]|uniref:Superfamily II DNA/RNA helicase n=3 Tax=Micrococcus endophyticus TaxID=455343 RepID=A0A7W9MZB2_9MICC|nr:DEAD/DEAH box helicase [Micrococcus endophyticus]MBB5847785.1 superfamily II DNA/RNA helicase [Micrococcus endophyticus]
MTQNSEHTPAPADVDPQVAEIAEEIVTEEAVETAPEQTFADFGVHPAIVQALEARGIVHPFPIQAMTLPVALGGHDIIGQAKTGTGKTLGFGIPALQRAIGPGEPGWDKLEAKGSAGAPQALIVAPTRELAVQVAGDLTAAAAQRPLRIATIYGGRAYEPQIEELQRGVEVVVGTPGRLIDLMRQRHLRLDLVNTVVLDEADEMLDLGFLPDVETLLGAVPAVRQTMLFSATMPGPVVAMARRYMTQPTHIRAADPEDEGLTKKDIRQLVYRAHHMDKDELVARALQAEGRGRTIIFTRTKRTAARVADELTARGFAAGALHGDLGQGAREQALRAFRNGKVDILVATDVAARGIDVDDVTHVFNFQAPEDEKTYVHRVGRTGRAGNKGVAVTLVDWEDMPRWSLIDKALGLGQPEPQETYSSSPHLFADLGIPKGTKGRLPKEKRVLEGLEGEVLEDLGGPESAPRGRGGRTRDGERDGGRGGRGGRGERGSRGGRGGRSRDDERGGRDGGRGGRGERAGREGGRGRDAEQSPARGEEAGESKGRGRGGERAGREGGRGESTGRGRGGRSGESRTRGESRTEASEARAKQPVAGVERTEARMAERAEARAEARRRRGGRTRTRRRNGEVVDG